jgi:segregation and condensation protein B
MDETANRDGDELKRCVESMLFVADEPVRVEHLAAALEIAADAVEGALSALEQEYTTRGIRLQRHGNRIQLVSAPEAAPLIRRFLGLEQTSKLSPAALEALAIVAYRQPVTRAEIEAVRGVNSDSVLRTLVGRGLIEEMGRLDQVGRPILYGTSFLFLQHFGLQSLDQLRPLDWRDEMRGDSDNGRGMG